MNEGINLSVSNAYRDTPGITESQPAKMPPQTSNAPPDTQNTETDFQTMYAQAVSSDGAKKASGVNMHPEKSENSTDKSADEAQTDQTDLTGKEDTKADQSILAAEGLSAGTALPIQSNSSAVPGAGNMLTNLTEAQMQTAAITASSNGAAVQTILPEASQMADKATGISMQASQAAELKSETPANPVETLTGNGSLTDIAPQPDQTAAMTAGNVRPVVEAQNSTPPAEQTSKVLQDETQINDLPNVQKTAGIPQPDVVSELAQTQQKTADPARSDLDIQQTVLPAAEKTKAIPADILQVTGAAAETQSQDPEPLMGQPTATTLKTAETAAPVSPAVEPLSAVIQNSSGIVSAKEADSTRTKKSDETVSAAQSAETAKADILPEQTITPQRQTAQVPQTAQKNETVGVATDSSNGTDSTDDEKDALVLDASSKGVSLKGTESSQIMAGSQSVTDMQAANGTLMKEQPAPLPAYSQISDEILKQLSQKGPTQFQMSLQPADLGQIDIKLSLRNSKLIIDITAANAKTQSLLTNQVDNLITSMGLQNAKVEIVQTGNNTMTGQETLSNQTQTYTATNGFDFSQSGQGGFSQKDNTGNLSRWAAAALQNANAAADELAVSNIGSAQGVYLGRLDYSI